MASVIRDTGHLWWSAPVSYWAASRHYSSWPGSRPAQGAVCFLTSPHVWSWSLIPAPDWHYCSPWSSRSVQRQYCLLNINSRWCPIYMWWIVFVLLMFVTKWIFTRGRWGDGGIHRGYTTGTLGSCLKKGSHIPYHSSMGAQGREPQDIMCISSFIPISFPNWQ